MANKPTSYINLAVNERAAVDGLKRFTEAFKTSATAWNQSAELLKKAWGAVSGAIGAVVDHLGDAVQAYLEADAAERRAIAALELHGVTSSRTLEGLKELNAEMQRKLGIDADNLLQLQGTLAAMGVMPHRLEDATRATIGLAEATGKSLDAAGRAVAKTLNGNTAELRKMGIEARDTEDGLRQLVELFGLAEAQSGSMATLLKTLGANWGDFTEAQGKAIAESDSGKRAIDGLNRMLEELTRRLNDPNLDTGWDRLTGRVMDFFGVFAQHYEALGGAGPAAAISALVQTVVGTSPPQSIPVVPLKTAEPPSDGAMEFDAETITGRPRKPGRGRGLDESLSARAQEVLEAGRLESEAELERAEQLHDLRQRELAAKAEWARQEEDLETQRLIAQREHTDQEYAQRREHFDRLNALGQQQLAQTQAIWGQMVTATVVGLVQMGGAVISGEQTAGSAMKGLLGRLASMIGQFMIAMGGAVIASGVAAANIANPITAIPAGIALAAAGAAFLALGSHLTKSLAKGGGGATPAPSPRDVARSSGGGGSIFGGPRPVAALAGAGEQVINIHFNGLVLDERRAARRLEDVLRGHREALGRRG